MKINKFDRDAEYWDRYYEDRRALNEESRFAHFVLDNYLKNKERRLLELGCGNGRDSSFFINKSFVVTGVDASKKAIDALVRKYGSKSESQFICDDFVAFKDEKQYAYVYSRFSIHAISEEQETQLFERLGEMIETGGHLFIEVRSVNDEIYGLGKCVAEDAFIYEGHFRRFIRIERLVSKMVKNGFIIDYAAERRGFAPYGNDDPMVIRVVGRKK